MDIYIYNNLEEKKAFEQTTHLAITAHQDDVEFIAYAGIAECFGKKDKFFSAVITSNGSGSPRAGVYEKYTDEEMMKVRKLEQKKAAMIGEYSFLAMLDHPSKDIKNAKTDILINEIYEILMKSKPDVVYTHNLADKHDTHVATAIRTILAIRKMPKQDRPKLLYGCECWRGLDWLCDSDKTCLDVSAKQNLASALMGVFDSQISGGKAYDIATTGRRVANATYLGSHSVDTATHLTYALDMSKLMDEYTDIKAFIMSFIENMKNEINTRIDSLI